MGNETIWLEIKNIWGEKYVKCFWANSIRYEDIDWDWQKAYRCIYINGERVESAPLCATEREARMRLLELCEENGVEEEQEIWKPLDDLRDKSRWKSTDTMKFLQKLEQEE